MLDATLSSGVSIEVRIVGCLVSVCGLCDALWPCFFYLITIWVHHTDSDKSRVAEVADSCGSKSGPMPSTLAVLSASLFFISPISDPRAQT